MQRILNKHTLFWKDKTIRHHVLLSVALLIISLFLSYFSRSYAGNYLNNVIPDLLLEHLPVVNVGYVFFQGAFLFLLMLVGTLVWEPKHIPFVLESSALFFSVRSFFVTMTHLSAPAIEYYTHIGSNATYTISSGNDLFFSGHAGFPFLLALIFWHYKPFRYLFLLSSLVGSTAVLLGHLHYSIDVFSSYFIAFGVFKASEYFFKKERILMRGA